jgi:hypothetical protein
VNGYVFTSTPRMQIVWDALEAAKDSSDEIAIAACRRLIVADRLGWRKHAKRGDIDLVMALAEPPLPQTPPCSGLQALEATGWSRLSGLAVHLAARIMAESAPGAILTSRTVKDLAVGSGASFTPIGRREMKGISESWELYALAG